MELLGIPEEKAHRITFNEITKNVVIESLNQPRQIKLDLVSAKQAHSRQDSRIQAESPPVEEGGQGLSAGRSSPLRRGSSSTERDPGLRPEGILEHRSRAASRCEKEFGEIVATKANRTEKRKADTGDSRCREGRGISRLFRENGKKTLARPTVHVDASAGGLAQAEHRHAER